MESKESLYNGHLSDYSEDFEEEQESEVRAAPAVVQTATRTPRARGAVDRRAKVPAERNTKSHSVARKRSGSKSYKGLTHKARAFSDIKRFSMGSKLTPTPKKWAQGKSSLGFSPGRDRMLSAKNHALRTLQNELGDTRRELGELKKENRLLNRLQARQERELDRFQSEEGELPQILIRHAEEVRVLKEQLRRSQDVSQAHQQKASSLREELLRTQDRKRKLEEVVKKRRLLEREALTVQLQQARDSTEEKAKQITDLERGMEVMSRNHAQEVRTLLHKNRVLTLEAEGLRGTAKKVQSQLKEKEKEIDVMNIYSQRMQKNVPHPLPRQQAPPTGTSESQTELSCPPFKAVSLKTKPQLRTEGSQTELETPKPSPRTKKLISAGTQTEVSTGTQSGDETDSLLPTRGVHLGADKTSGVSVKETRQSIPETLQSRKEADLGASAVAVEPSAPSSVNETSKGKLATPAASDQGSKGVVDEERQKKDLLLARLRALDGQKGPPGSEPVNVGGLVRSSAEPTANEPVELSHPGAAAPTLPSKPAATATVQRQAALKQANAVATKAGGGSSSAEAEAKKKLLLAKLMAIDEGKNPREAAADHKDSSKEPSKLDTKLTSSATHSDSSLKSWPDKIENMHHGKPAYSSDGDPFGSRHHLSAKRESGSAVKTDSSAITTTTTTTEGGTDAKPKFGRRQPSQKPAASSSLDLFGGGPLKSELGTATEKNPPKPGRHKPSLVRQRAENATPIHASRKETVFGGLDLETESKDIVLSGETTTGPFGTNTASDSRPIAGRSRDYPWETRVDVSSKPSEPILSSLEPNKKTGGVASVAKGPLSSTARIFGGGLGSGHGSASGSRPLLPLRQKAEPIAVSSFDAMPGSAIGEPDDIEEIVL